MVKNYNFKNINKLSAIIFILTISQNASADIKLEQSGSVTAGSEYHQNLLLLPDRFKESVILYRLIPEYKISALDERNEWFGKLGVLIERSSDKNIAANVENPFAQLGWKHEFSLGTLSFQGNYVKQRTVQSQFGVTGVVSQNGTSDQQTYTLGWTYGFSPNWSLDTGLMYSKISFSGVDQLTGFENKSARAALNYSLSETVKPYVSVEAFFFTPEDDQFTQINRWQQYLAGANVEFSPRFTLNVNAGITRFNSDVDDGRLGSAILSYVRNRHSISGSISRAVFPTGEQSVETGDTLGGSYSYELSSISAFGLNGSFTQNESSIDTQFYSASYTRNLTPSWMLNFNLTRRVIDDSLAEKFDDNSLGFNLTYTSPNF